MSTIDFQEIYEEQKQKYLTTDNQNCANELTKDILLKLTNGFSYHHIRQLKFQLFTPEEIERYSVAKITEKELYDKQHPKFGSVNDLRLGVLNRKYLCSTCQKNMVDCPGHEGHIELGFPMYHVGFIHQLHKILNMICFFCSALLISQSELDSKKLPKFHTFSANKNHIFKCKNPKVRFEKLSKCKKLVICEICGAPQPIYNIITNGIEINIKTKWKDSIAKVLKVIEKEYVKKMLTLEEEKEEPIDTNQKKSLKTNEENRKELLKNEFQQTKKRGRPKNNQTTSTNDNDNDNNDKQNEPVTKKVKKTVSNAYKPKKLFDNNITSEGKIINQKGLRSTSSKDLDYLCADEDDHELQLQNCILKNSPLNESNESNVTNETNQVSNGHNNTFNLHLLKQFLQTNFIQHGSSESAVKTFMCSSNYLELPVSHSNQTPNQLTKYYETAHQLIVNTFLQNKKISSQELEVWYSLTVLFQQVQKLQEVSRKAFTAADSLLILHRLTISLYTFMGFRSNPSSMIITNLIVPPPIIRPAPVTTEGKTRSHEDLTEKLKEIVIKNNILCAGIEVMTSGKLSKLSYENYALLYPSFSEKDKVHLYQNIKELQYQIAVFFNNDVHGLKTDKQRSGTKTKSISERLKRKEGRFRGNILGKRVEQSARSVIGPDPWIDVDELVVPENIAMTLSKSERVTNFNRTILAQRIQNGPNHLFGAKIIKLPDQTELDLSTMNETKRFKLACSLPIGSIVERYLQDGDEVVFNRQPTLHKPSAMAHRAIIKKGLTFRLNLCVVQPYNADFDGDEMNMHVVQSEKGKAEVATIMRVHENVVTAKASKPCMGFSQDSCVGISFFTKKDSFFTKEQFCQFLMQTKYLNYYKTTTTTTTTSADINYKYHLPIPAILKPKPLWTGKQVVSCLLPSSFYFSKWRDEAPENQRSNWMDVHDRHVFIKNGLLLTGRLCKDTIGSSTESIVHHMWRLISGTSFEYMRNQLIIKEKFNDCFPILNEKENDKKLIQSMSPHLLTCKFLSDLQRIINYYFMEKGFSVGISDNILVPEVKQKIKECQQHIFNKIDLMYSEMIDKEKFSKEDLEPHITSLLDQSFSYTSTIADNSLNDSNPNYAMIHSKSKGNITNIGQMMANVGNQVQNGERMIHGLPLPGFNTSTRNIKAQGYITNSFYEGLTSYEFFYHAMGGREGLIDTAVKTAIIGYIQRCLMTAMKEFGVEYDGTVRNPTGEIIQFAYGADNFDASHLLYVSLPNLKEFLIDNPSYQTVYENYIENGLLVEIQKQSFTDYLNCSKHNKKKLTSKASVIGPNETTDTIDYQSIILFPFQKDLNSTTSSTFLYSSPDEKQFIHETLIPKNWYYSSDEYNTLFTTLHKSKKIYYTEKQKYYHQYEINYLLKLWKVINYQRSKNILQLQNENTISKGIMQPCNIEQEVATLKAELSTSSSSHSQNDFLTVRIIVNTVRSFVHYWLQKNENNNQTKQRLLMNLYLSRDLYLLHNLSSKLLLFKYQIYTKTELHLLLRRIYFRYEYARVHAYEMVGSLAAESIGEPCTQMTLNTFHQAGKSAIAVTSGIPRMKELFSMSKNIKTPSAVLFVDDKLAKNESLFFRWQNLIPYTLLEDIVLIDQCHLLWEPNLHVNQVFEEWSNNSSFFSSIVNQTDADLVKLHQNIFVYQNYNVNDYPHSRWVIRIVLKKLELTKRGLIPHDIARVIRNFMKVPRYQDMTTYHNLVISSEVNMNDWIIRIRVPYLNHVIQQSLQTDLKQFALNEDDIKRHEYNLCSNYMHELFKSVEICGIAGIKKTVSSSNSKQSNSETIVKTLGSNLYQLWLLDGADWRKTTSNVLHEVYELLGIEAVVELLFHEIKHVMVMANATISDRHIMVLVDTMTRSGYMVPNNRFGFNRLHAPLSRASFEETLDNLQDAALFGEVDLLNDIISNITIGQTIPAGTGKISLHVDPIYVNAIAETFKLTGTQSFNLFNDKNKNHVYCPNTNQNEKCISSAIVFCYPSSTLLVNENDNNDIDSQEIHSWIDFNDIKDNTENEMIHETKDFQKYCMLITFKLREDRNKTIQDDEHITYNTNYHLNHPLGHYVPSSPDGFQFRNQILEKNRILTDPSNLNTFNEPMQCDTIAEKRYRPSSPDLFEDIMNEIINHPTDVQFVSTRSCESSFICHEENDLMFTPL